MRETVHEIWLSLGIGPGGAFGKLFDTFGDVYGIYSATAGDLDETGLPGGMIRKLKNKDLGEAARIAAFCEKHNIEITVYGKPGYPGPLTAIDTPPYLLYVSGRLPDFERRFGLGIVGSRNMTGYGMRTAYRTAYETAAAGAVIVSGMARGIDGTAAVGALEAGGTTVAVTGSGLDAAYPAEHDALMKAIAGSGAVISEYPPGSPPLAGHFPVRNRLIAGLSDALLVVEAGRKSGAMLTADIALNQGKNIFAVPGRTEDPSSEGPNSLLGMGAGICLSGADILSPYLEKYPSSLNSESYARATVSSAVTTEILAEYGVKAVVDDCTGNIYPAPPEPAVSVTVPKKRQTTPKTEQSAQPAAADRGRGRLPPEGEQRDFYLLIPRGERVGADFFADRGYSPRRAMELLTLLEISGYITGVPGGLYVL
ncbi:MAG: DNA-processing protein DprA [Clostridia bacterium]|nr:DNA-processing protein DprA [Clostridia bacterium]